MNPIHSDTLSMDTAPTPRAIDTVLVLGGGGGRGAAELGVLRALAEQGVQPDAVVGTSVGALNAAALAGLPIADAVSALEEIWASPQTRAVFRNDLLQIVGNRMRGRSYLRNGQAITDLVDYSLEKVHLTTFEALPIPLRVIVTDLRLGSPVIFENGGLRDPLRASCAIPGIFPPVRIRSREYVDGGVVENCSLASAMALAPRRVIAIDLSADDEEIRTSRRWHEIIDRVMQVSQHNRVVADFDRFSSRMPVTLICPRIHFGNLRFTDFGGLMTNACDGARALLARITDSDGGLQAGVFYLPVAAQ